MRTLRLLIPAFAIVLLSCSDDAPKDTSKPASASNENPDAVEVQGKVVMVVRKVRDTPLVA